MTPSSGADNAGAGGDVSSKGVAYDTTTHSGATGVVSEAGNLSELQADVPLGAPAPQAAGSAVDFPGIGPSVIKIADLSVRVPDGDFKDAIKDAVSVAKRYGGFVLATNVSDREAGRGSVELRIPAESFEAALADLHDLGDLRSENISGVDVSQEFVDLEARLRNLESQERVLRRLMNDAISVSDTLKVQSELQRVQLDIEQIRGRLNYLNDQTDLGTITVSVTELGAVPTKVGVLERAWTRALDLATGVVSSVIVGAGFVIPTGILVMIFVLVLTKLRPRFAGNLERP
jgi:hypothetical protein